MIKGLIPSVVVFAIFICLVSPVWAMSNVINFDDNVAPLAAPFTISDFGDVVFTKGGSTIVNAFGDPGGAFSGPRNAKSDPFSTASPFRGDFNISGVNFVSVVLGDNGGDQDNLFLEAYGSSGLLLNTDQKVLGANTGSGFTLAVESNNSDISYVLFGSQGDNSVAFDDFTYSKDSTDHNPLPEPSSILLLGTGLAGLAAWRYKKSVLNK